MREISLIYKRLPDKVSRIAQELLFESSDLMIMRHQVQIPFPLSIDGDVVLDSGYWALWFVFFEKWHDIGKFYTPEGKFRGFYCDLITPAIRRGKSEVEITDLFLDLWISPDGKYTVLDEAEFDEALKKDWIDELLAQRAKAELSDLIEGLKGDKFPPRFVKSYNPNIPFLKRRIAI